ncbi:MAG: glycosyltransferase family 1 protein [Acidobacteria bacterium]|nr:glycosyltransferase family 1 protein [Acidobacteriota bacterium]
MRVTFFLDALDAEDDEEDLDGLRRLDPDRDWRSFQRGEQVWVLQTYLRLARAGRPVELAAAPPGEGLIVFHAKQARALRRQRHLLGDAVLVAARADNRQPLIADFEIVQNGRFADGRRRFHVPHWPQPGLLPRDPARGTAIRRLVYKGFDGNLHPDFRGPEWRELLAARGIEWVVDAARFAGRDTDSQALDWPDFRAADLVLAVRPEGRSTNKPASKLVNAWLAGVPALLGPEIAYRELRRSELDYFEISSLAEARSAVDRLLGDPGLYEAMVENGRARAAEFTAEALLPRWETLLFETIPALVPPRWSRRVPLALRAAGRWLGRTATLRPAR